MRRILILDDQVRYLRSLDRALRNEFDIVSASSLEEAKAKADERIEVVLSDVRLNEADIANRDGLRFIRWVRSNLPKTSVIAMSAIEDDDVERDALLAGATTFLPKPI